MRQGRPAARHQEPENNATPPPAQPARPACARHHGGPGIAHAQDGAWPGRQPIRLIAGFPAGGLADAIGRLFAAPRSPAPMGEEFSRFVAGFRDHWVAMARAQGIVAS